MISRPRTGPGDTGRAERDFKRAPHSPRCRRGGGRPSIPHLTAIDLRHAKDVLPPLFIDRRFGSLVAGREGHISDHLGGDDLVDVRRAVRERLGKGYEQLTYLLLTGRRAPRAENRNRLS